MMSEELHVGIFTVGEEYKTYTDKFPNDLPKYGTSNPDKAPFKKLFEFPITALVHNTHTEEKEGICQKRDGKARFKANEKLSRPTTIKMRNGWDFIEKGEKLLPSKYVWFSMKPTLPEDREFNKKDYNVPYVNGTTFYGPWSFTFDYSKLISSYKKHIQNHSDPGKRDATVVLRNGGTLKYQREICYVVIVTHSKDTLHKNTRYPIIENEEVLTITKQQHGDMSLPMCVFHPRCTPPPFVPKGSPPPPNWAGYNWAQLGYYDHVVFAIHCDWEGEIKFKSEVKLAGKLEEVEAREEEPEEEEAGEEEPEEEEAEEVETGEEEPEEEEPGEEEPKEVEAGEEEPEEEEAGEEEPEEVEQLKNDTTPVLKLTGKPYNHLEDCVMDTSLSFLDDQDGEYIKRAYCNFHPLCLTYADADTCYSREYPLWQSSQKAEDDEEKSTPPKKQKM